MDANERIGSRRYRHAGSDAEILVRRSEAMILRSRLTLAGTEDAAWDQLLRAWEERANR